MHAAVAAAAGERAKLEHLRRYVARPAVASARQAVTAAGAIRYTLKTPYRDGMTQVLFEPLDFLSRLAALMPLPQLHLTRHHGVLAPHSRLRARVTPGGHRCRRPRARPQTPLVHGAFLDPLPRYWCADRRYRATSA